MEVRYHIKKKVLFWLFWLLMFHNKWLWNVVSQNSNHFLIHGFCGSDVWTKCSRDGLCWPRASRSLAEEIERLGLTSWLGIFHYHALHPSRVDWTVPPNAPVCGFSMWFKPHSCRVLRFLTCWLRAPSTGVPMNRADAASAFITQPQMTHGIISPDSVGQCATGLLNSRGVPPYGEWHFLIM